MKCIFDWKRGISSLLCQFTWVQKSNYEAASSWAAFAVDEGVNFNLLPRVLQVYIRHLQSIFV